MAGVSVPTIKRAEADGGIRVSEDAKQLIQRALKKAGVEFIWEGQSVGVRFRSTRE